MPYNPYSPSYPYNIQSGTTDLQGVTWVNSLIEVEATRVPYGKQIFMDRNNPYFYVKDYTGVIKCFKFEEVPLPSQNPDNYVTKEEFDQLRMQYEQLVSTVSATTATQPAEPAQPYVDHAADVAVPGDTGASQAGVLQQGSPDGAVTITAQQPLG